MALTTNKKSLDSLYKAVSSQIKIDGEFLGSTYEIYKIETFKEIDIFPTKVPADSVVQDEIEDEVDFVHVYSDDLLPQFISNDNEYKDLNHYHIS